MDNAKENLIDNSGPAATRGFGLKRVVTWVATVFRWPLLAVPLLMVFVVLHLSENDYFGWSDRKTCKALMEIVHPCLLLGFALLALQSLRLTKQNVYGWLAVLGASLFCREIHFTGSGMLNYAVMSVFLFAIFKKTDQFTPLVKTRWAISFFVMCIVCYSMMELMDRGVVKRIGRIVTWDRQWSIPHASNIEECLESLGGLFLVTSIFFMKRPISPPSPPGDLE